MQKTASQQLLLCPYNVNLSRRGDKCPKPFLPQMALLPTDTSTINTDMIILEQFIEQKFKSNLKSNCAARGEKIPTQKMMEETCWQRHRGSEPGERGRGIARERGRGVSRGGLGDGSGGGGAAIGKE